MNGRGIEGLRSYDGNGTRSNNGGSAVVSHSLVKVLADMVEHALARDAGRLGRKNVQSAPGDEGSRSIC